jgi:predicted alpha/beta hydrolase
MSHPPAATPTPSERASAPTEPVTITCEDGTRLQGHFLQAHQGRQAAQHRPVLISPATGVRQHFYLRFAQWLADLGHDVLVFDYRGIGLSLHGPLKHCKATLAQWGQQDQVAALEFLLHRTGAAQALILGHSAGGQMIGLLPNHQRVAGVVGVASSTGWFKAMRPAFRFQARLALRGAVPLAATFMGYAPTSKFGLGEDLPTQVARQWGQWCAAGGYATNAVKRTPHLDFHGLIQLPITVLHASDDDIANADTVADLLRTFPAAHKCSITVRPQDHGLKRIGHIDWFRPSHQALWPLMAKALAS